MLLPSIFIFVFFIIILVGLCSLGYRSRNVLYTFIAIEIIFLNFGLVAALIALSYDNYTGYTLAMCLLALSAAEAGLGFALLIAFYKKTKTTNLTKIKKLFKN